MPKAGKVFIYREELSIEEISGLLEGWRESEHVQFNGDSYDLLSDIQNLHLNEGELTGLYQYDYVISPIYRGTIQHIPVTDEASFLFTEHEHKTFLLVMAKKSMANSVANKFSLILHEEMGTIVEAMIHPSVLTGFYQDADGTKILLFDNIEIPNMDKATLYGENVVQTNFHGDFASVGDPWYIVAKTKKRGYTVGLVRDGSVVVFSAVDESQFVEYVKDEIMPLVLRRKTE